MPSEKLKPREARFVEGICRGLGKKDAAIAAGCPPQSAHVRASDMLDRPRVLNAIRAQAEKMLNTSVIRAAQILEELAENAKSEDVKLRAAQALLDRGGMMLVRQSEVRHTLEDRRSDQELIENIRRLQAQLGVAPVIDVTPEPTVPALPAPAANIFED